MYLSKFAFFLSVLFIVSCADSIDETSLSKEIEIPASRPATDLEIQNLIYQINQPGYRDFEPGISKIRKSDFEKSAETVLDWNSATSINDDFGSIIVNEEGFDGKNKKIAVVFGEVNQEHRPTFIYEFELKNKNHAVNHYYTMYGEYLFTGDMNLSKGEIRFKLNKDKSSDCESSYGEAVMACVDNAYTDQGWASLLIGAATAVKGCTFAYVAGRCAYENWPSRDDECYDEF